MDKNAEDATVSLLQFPREVEEDKEEDIAQDQELYYQLKLNKITNALLVPADMLSAKLNKSTATNVQQAQASGTPVSSYKKEDLAHDRICATDIPAAESNNNKNGNSPSLRYKPYHSPLRAAVLNSPENTYYVEDTFVIGSYGQRKPLLAAEPLLQESGERTPKTSSFLYGNGDDSAKKSPSATARSSPLLSPQSMPMPRQAEVPSSPNTRSGMTFQVRKPSKVTFGVDNIDDDTVVDDPLLADGSSAKKKKKKHVSFPENVIKSVSVIEAEDQLRLLVEYNRPWYAYLVLFFASAFFVIGWAFIERGVAASSISARVAAAPVYSFVSFSFASVYLLLCLSFMWRPEIEERRTLRDFTQNRPVLYVLFFGIVAQLSIVCALMLTSSSVCIVCFCCCPLVLTYTYEEYKKHSVSFLDAAGCFFVVCSFIVFTAGSEIMNKQDLYRRIVPVVIAIIGGFAMAFFLFQVRTVSRQVSNLFIMTSTLTLTSILLAFISYIAGGFTTPIGTSQKPLVHISSADFLNMVLSALFIFLSWFTYHWSSLFFDRMTLSGSFSLGAPITLLVFHLMGLHTVELAFEIAGGVSLVVGCGLVLVSGYQFRKNVEVQIDLERE